MELQNVNRVTLSDGHQYSGWGYFSDGNFVPNGCGRKFYDGYYVYGNFIDNVLNGPAIVSHDYYMNTAIFKNNRGNGWGLCINGGTLIEFGYYENSRIKVNLLDFVEWYYEKMISSGRNKEDMLTMYTFNDSKQVSELLIGYSGKDLGGGLASTFMGFRFKSDGSVWVGSTGTRRLTGNLIHFRADGQIDVGKFEDGVLIECKNLHEVIDEYYGIYHFDENDIFSAIMASKNKSSRQIENEKKREKFRNVPEVKINYDYINGFYVSDDDDLPF